MKYLLLTILSLACACVISCAYWQKFGTPANIEIVAYEACHQAGKHVPFDKQATVHAQAYAASLAIRSFEKSGRLPSGDQLAAVITQFAGKDWADLAHSVGVAWDLTASHFGSGVSEAFTALEAFARGVEKWAALPVPLPFETPHK